MNGNQADRRMAGCDVTGDLWRHVLLGVIWLPDAFEDDLATDVLPDWIILRSGNPELIQHPRAIRVLDSEYLVINYDG